MMPKSKRFKRLKWLGICAVAVVVTVLVGGGVKVLLENLAEPTPASKADGALLARPQAPLGSPGHLLKGSNTLAKAPPPTQPAMASDWQARLEKFMAQKGVRPEQLPEQELQALGQRLSQLINELNSIQSQKQAGQLPSNAKQLHVVYLAFSIRNQLFDLTQLELTDLLQANGMVDGVMTP